MSLSDRRRRGPRLALWVCLAVLPGAASALGAGPDAAGPWLLTADPERTRIHFTLRATLHKVEGSARLDSGSVRIDPLAGTARGRFVVDATSLATGNERRDRDMHSKVLESEAHPTIVLMVDGLAGELRPDSDFELELEGRLEIHGSSHPLRLTASGRLEQGTVTATTQFVVPYVEWGMKDPSKLLLRVAKEVEVAVELAATLEPVPEP